VVNGWDVARHAGVSQATVSRVMRGDSKVTPQTRELVMRAAEEFECLGPQGLNAQ